jgi:hypothetical protein
MAMAYPAEVYSDRQVAEREAERWAWILSGVGQVAVDRPFPGRWEVGEAWIRLVESEVHGASSEIWVGTHWTRHGYPEPEAALFADRAEARRWATTPPMEGVLSSVYESPWVVAATFTLRGEEEDSVAQLAKVVS